MQKIMDISRKQLLEIKPLLKNLIKNKIFYVYLLLLALFLPAVFFDWMIYPAIAVTLISAVFFDPSHMISIVLFQYPFFSIFVVNGRNFYFYLFAVVVLIFGVKFIIDVVKKKRTLDLFLIALIAVYCLFLLLPIRESVSGGISNNCNITNLSSVGVFFVFLYLVYKYRDEIDFLKILRIFVIGFLLSGLFGLFAFCSTRLQGVMSLIYYHGYDLQRFNGLFVEPNTLAIISSVVFSLILYLYYHKKIGVEAHIYITFTFLLGYVTLARSFLYAMAISFVLYVIAVIVRDKKDFYKSVLPFLIEFAIVTLICFEHSKVHFQRADMSDLVHGYDHGTVDTDVTDSAENFVDPGRGGLIKIYLKDYLSSVLVVLFGRGISHPWFGSYSAHNTYLQAFWNTGLIGVSLLIVIAFLFLKKFTNLKFVTLLKKTFTDLSLYQLLIPVLAIMFIENLFMNMQMIVVVMVVLFAILIVKRKAEEIGNEKLVEDLEENKKI